MIWQYVSCCCSRAYSQTVSSLEFAHTTVAKNSVSHSNALLERHTSTASAHTLRSRPVLGRLLGLPGCQQVPDPFLFVLAPHTWKSTFLLFVHSCKRTKAASGEHNSLCFSHRSYVLCMCTCVRACIVGSHGRCWVCTSTFLGCNMHVPTKTCRCTYMFIGILLAATRMHTHT